MIILFVGSSGSGKNAIADQLGLPIICSATTRERREGESMTEQYIFLTDQEFDELVENEAFAEHKTYIGNGKKYGTLKESIEPYIQQKEDAYMPIEAQGMKALKELYGQDILTFYIYASKETCAERMEARGDSYEDIESRLEAWSTEILEAHNCDYIINNDGHYPLEYLIEQVKDIITKRKNGEFDNSESLAHTQ